MFLTRLIYVSSVSDGFSKEDILDIKQTANNFNGDHGITGALYFNYKFFLQALEGGRQEVNDLYLKIIKDKRHYNPLILDYSNVDVRVFDKWSMNIIYDSKPSRELLIKYQTTDKFNPYSLSSTASLELLKNLVMIKNQD